MNVKTIEKLKNAVLKGEESLRSQLFDSQRCVDCKKNIYQTYIENLMKKMTLTK